MIIEVNTFNEIHNIIWQKGKDTKYEFVWTFDC